MVASPARTAWDGIFFAIDGNAMADIFGEWQNNETKILKKFLDDSVLLFAH